MDAAATEARSGATLVIHTRVRAGREADFARWQRDVAAAAAAVPGFLEQIVMPPRAPAHGDWVILQWFASSAAALAWLESEARRALVTQARTMVDGPDDVHIVDEASAEAGGAPASAVITTRIKPGTEASYRAWEHRIAAVLAKTPGFQGYRFEPPVPGAQDRWVVVVRFDSEARLQAWLRSPERHALLAEVAPFAEGLDAHLVRSGFDQWFAREEHGGAAPAAWKMSMLVLLLLYPIVFLLDTFAVPPLARRGSPLWLTLFLSNVTCVVLLGVLVPRVARRFDWWLVPAAPGRRVDLAGVAALLGLYGASLVTFAWLSHR